MHDGRVAQVDHLLINRLLEVWVLESKRFGEGLAINEHGESSAFFGGRPYGIPSPFEQNRKHYAVLEAFFKSAGAPLPKRLGFSLTPGRRLKQKWADDAEKQKTEKLLGRAGKVKL